MQIGPSFAQSRIISQHKADKQKGPYRMELLEQRILKDASVKEGNVLKVDSFLNHRRCSHQQGPDDRGIRHRNRSSSRHRLRRPCPVREEIEDHQHRRRGALDPGRVLHPQEHLHSHRLEALPGTFRPRADRRRLHGKRLRDGGALRPLPPGRSHGRRHRHRYREGLPGRRRPSARPGLPHRFPRNRRCDGPRHRICHLQIAEAIPSAPPCTAPVTLSCQAHFSCRWICRRLSAPAASRAAIADGTAGTLLAPAGKPRMPPLLFRHGKPYRIAQVELDRPALVVHP